MPLSYLGNPQYQQSTSQHLALTAFAKSTLPALAFVPDGRKQVKTTYAGHLNTSVKKER